MASLLVSAQRYLAELFPGDVSDLREWHPASLPYFLRDAFDLVQLTVHGHPIVLAAARAPVSQQTLHRMLFRLRNIAQSRVLYVAAHVTPYERKRLLTERVEFVVPDSQLFAPSLAIELREKPTTAAPPSEVLSLGPATQAVLLSLLLNDSGNMPTLTIARRLGYSPMTASRANRELEAAGLARVHRMGSKSTLTLDGSRADVWMRAKPLMRSPVAKQLHIASPLSVHDTVLKQAGETALAELTLLAHPSEPVFAIGPTDWRAYEADFTVVPEADTGTFMLQLWNYHPWLWADEATVDPLSLILSLEDVADDRVQIALEELENSFWQKSKD